MMLGAAMRSHRSTSRLLLGLLVAALACAGAADGRPGPGARCYGAASRDSEHPCFNRALLKAVTPQPIAALLETDAPFAPFDRGMTISTCWFGVAAAAAPPTIAIVGDSHAGHWRAAVDFVAQVRNWHGLSLTHSSCPLQKALRDLPEPRRSLCAKWKDQVFAWFTQHPEISTVFVAGLTGGSGVVPSGGRDAFETSVAGYRDAWNALPATVEHIVVIRDTPKGRADTNACVARAMARREALSQDSAAVAASRLKSPRVRVIDLTRFFCDRSRCYPVIGGALVYKDQNHMTETFAKSLGPFLLRAIKQDAS
jgi:hypothetical protein